ncbi:SLATT domain-containing protein [Streptomyces sp. ODS28]|uniref:SLATT domain-containing protein n=1 Tax=Streptomyces sp. ODS28 TaxID=3136688 RepID=UPI0031EC8365
MSQPEMRPEGASRKAGAGSGDLLGRAFPHGDWGEPAERLDELYQWVEDGALRMVEWYLADRVWKRRAARTLRAGTAACAGFAALLPVLELTGTAGAGHGGGFLAWGYAAVLGAVVCTGVDRYFGLTSGWMRDVATAQAVQRRLEALQYDWACESIREVLGPTEGTAGEAAERCLGVLRRFADDVTEIVRSETADWMVEFAPGGAAPLRVQQTVWTGARRSPSGEEHGSSPNGAPRFTLPPGARPSMPRQRPPEGPR